MERARFPTCTGKPSPGLPVISDLIGMVASFLIARKVGVALLHIVDDLGRAVDYRLWSGIDVAQQCLDLS